MATLEVQVGEYCVTEAWAAAAATAAAVAVATAATVAADLVSAIAGCCIR